MAMFKIIKGPEQGKEVCLSKADFTVGRGKSVDFCIADLSVSRVHASFVKEDSKWMIQDQNSNNGVFVNDVKVSKIELKEGDRITLGGTILAFSDQEKVIAKAPDTSSHVVIQSEAAGFDFDKSIVMDVEDFDRFSSHFPQEGIGVLDSSVAQKNFKKMQAMLRISNAVADIFDLKELITELLNIIFAETRATRGFIMLYDENKELVPMAVKKKNADDEVITISKTIINTVVNEKKAFLNSDLMNDERFKSGMSIIAHHIKSCMCVPLKYHEEILGVIHIDSDITSSIFSQDDLELLVALANQAAVCIKNAYLIKKITEEQNKRSRLSQYFPPAQVEMLMKEEINISLGGKKEEVTIIFCDIRGFTSISEHMQAMEVMDFLNEFFSVMTNIIFSFDGMVDNYMGDCIMAVFGGPFNHENDQERAVKAAIEMQKAQQELNKHFTEEGKKPFSIGIGIHSGEVSRGNIGSEQLKKYTVIGSNVNISSRLCSVAKAGEIILSAATAARLPADIALEKLEPVKVKNVSEPLQIFRVRNFCAHDTAVHR